MFVRVIPMIGAGLIAGLAGLVLAGGQQVKPPQASPAPAAPRASKKSPAPSAAPASANKAAAPAAPRPVDAADEARKKEILESSRWRRAMFEFQEWLNRQSIYDTKEVAGIKADLAARVAKMNSRELTAMLDDMGAKFQILESKPAQDAGAWLAQYLSILSDAKREEVLKQLPNISTMTPAQLNQEIARIQRKRQSMIRAQATFDQTRQAQVDAALKANQEAQQALRREQQARSPGGYTSPYRPTTHERPFENVSDPGPEMKYYVSPWGGVGFTFGS
jgi:hypothetical protein